MNFLVVNRTNTSNLAKEIYKLCVPTIEKSGFLIMFFPHDKLSEIGVEFLGVNFNALEVGVSKILAERGYGKQVLIAKDRSTYESLLRSLKRTCGVTVLEDFIDYVVASKQKNRRGMCMAKENLDYNLLRYMDIDATHIIIWVNFNFKWEGKRREKTYLFNKIKRYGTVKTL